MPDWTWAQWLMVVWMAYWYVGGFFSHGMKREPIWDVRWVWLPATVNLLLLLWGGFWK